MYRHVFVYSFLVTFSGWYTLTSAEVSSSGSAGVNATCIDVGECPTETKDCNPNCGCGKGMEVTPSTYDNNINDRIINMTVLMLSLKEKYNTEDKDTTEDDVDDMASKIRAEADRIFKGVIVAGFLFIVCASVCTLTACIYCCWMNYSDYQLKQSVNILAKKMGKKSQLKKRTIKEPTAPMAESCNVIVEDTGVFCV